jgi:hypothetical protein
MVKSYRDLKVWQRAIEMTLAIYRLTTGFPKEELFGLTSQIRRSGVSVASNIARDMVAATKASTSSFSEWPVVRILKPRHNCSSQLNWVMAIPLT